jgi:outer membrane protein TolC
VSAAAGQQEAASAGRRPNVAITGGVDYANPNPRIFPRAGRWDDFWDATINVGWSLWDGGRTRAEVLQAGNLTDAARQRLAEFDSVLALEVQQRLLEIDSGRAAVVAADDGVKAAAENRRVVNERFMAGLISQTDALDAETDLLQAELDRTRAIATVRLAEARLDRAIGR